MADAAVSFAVENVGGFLIEEAKFLAGVKDEVEEMQVELEWMQCFLEDAERRKGENRRVRHWVSQIREATYEVEDLIERFFLKSILRDRKGVWNRVKKYRCCNINRVVEYHLVGSRIEAIKAKLITLRKRLKMYGIKELPLGGEEVVAGGASATGRRKRQDYPHVVDHNVVGLDEKITELVEQLVDLGGQQDHGCRQAPASVVCLHGMGGVGKTTAAKKVYNDSRIRDHFEGFAWVYISQQFDARQVWESILTQLSGITVEIKTMDELTSKLCAVQKEKRCLLVIDDIWNHQDWVILSTAFTYEDKDSKSKMLLTTRNEGVVSNAMHVYSTNLNVLDEDRSLDLLTKTISYLGGPKHPINENSEMKECAVDMVKQCGGLPLAITVLGGILAMKHELIEWEKVGVNIKLVLKKGEKEGNERVISVLESSYKELPHNLRSCFLYFSQSREDEEINTTELKQKWIGEGFVSSSMEEGDETMEDIAEEYLQELVHRCVIQAGRKSLTGRIKTCRIHDLMRDMCISKAKEEGFGHTIKLGDENEGKNLKNLSFRRLCISSCNHKLDKSVLSSLERISPRLRSVWFHNNQCKETVFIVKNLKLVRVLELPSTMWDEIGKRGREEVGNLIHLRFLNLTASMLPTSIGNLICLQTLNLGSCNSNLKIPGSVWQMIQLRHLYLPKDGGVCESEKQQVSHFKNLQTLVNFPPRNFNLEQNLDKFINVRKLVITQRSEDICNILQSGRIEFKKVESLSFRRSSEKVDLEAVTRSCPYLYRLCVMAPINFTTTASCGIVLPSNLTKLVLRHSRLDGSHMSTLGKLRSLKILVLLGNAFAGKEMVFHGNDFPRLQHLILQNLKKLKVWTVEKGGLPSLSCLEIAKCWELDSVGNGAQYLKELKELKFRSMPYMFRKRLEKGGEDCDRFTNKPSISFYHCYSDSEIYGHTSSDILDEISSLELLYKTILFLGDPDHPLRENSEMDTSAREMVKVCEGVPLAITILGTILATRHEMEEWKIIESVLIEGRGKGKYVVTSMLELSYKDLPDNLRSCFLWFSQYLRGEEIETTEIIQRWIGEGSVSSSMEDEGQEHLKELVSRRLIQVGRRSHRGRVKTYRMHKFVWHFCVSKAKEEGFALSLHQLGVGDEETILEKVKFHRLCISSGESSYKVGGSIISFLLEISSQLVSVWFQDDLDDEQGRVAVFIVKNLNFVKVLNLPDKVWSLVDESWREQIGNLVNLRFLKLEGSELPKSFGNLRCLHTLNLERCVKDLTIPDWVWGMEQLRHLYLPEKGSVCESSRQKVGDFSDLQTLVNFPPRNFDLKQNLMKFNNVRKLVIIKMGEEMVSIWSSEVIMFNSLQSLSCIDYEEVDLEALTRGCPCLYRLFVQGLIKFPAAPSCTTIWPSNLTKLVLRWTNIDESQLGSVAKLQSLQVLFLQWNAFAGKEIVFHENDFPQLHHLMIVDLEHLETWAVQEGALPNLLCLEIVNCRKLKSVGDGAQFLKLLKDLKVEDMPYHFRKRLEEGGEDWDRVRHVPSISFIGCDDSRCIIEEEKTDAEQSSGDCCLKRRSGKRPIDDDSEITELEE